MTRLQRQAAATKAQAVLAVPRASLSTSRRSTSVPQSFAPAHKASVAAAGRSLTVKVAAQATAVSAAPQASGLKIDLTGGRLERPQLTPIMPLTANRRKWDLNRAGVLGVANRFWGWRTARHILNTGIHVFPCFTGKKVFIAGVADDQVGLQHPKDLPWPCSAPPTDPGPWITYGCRASAGPSLRPWRRLAPRFLWVSG